MTSTPWQNVSAGPRQLKALTQAVSALQWEGKNRVELYGVVGGKEDSSVVAGMCDPVRGEVIKLDEEIREKYGHQVTVSNVRAIIADYEAAMPKAVASRPVDDNRRTAEEDAELTAKRDEQNAEQDARRSASAALLDQAMTKAPAGAKALIYAELHQDTSDPQTDYFGSQVTRTVAIGFRTSFREDFRALRAAAASFPETAHLAEGDTEHRQNYSMGGGNFLSDHGSSSWGSGWVVLSRDFPCAYLPLTQDATPERATAPAAVPVRAVVPPRLAQAVTVRADVLDILRTAVAEGNSVKIAGRLDRETYVKLADALKAAGGKWNRGAQAFLFGEDAALVLAALLEAGSVVRPQDEGWFPTPAPVIARMLELADLTPSWGHYLLEPSAGEGAIASAFAAAGCTVDCVELNAKRAGVIYAAGYARSVTMADFLALPPCDAYDRIVMNPPFAGKADIAHVRHALRFLRVDGVLVAVMSAGVTFREDRETTGFREMVLNGGGSVEPLPEGSFKESGTDVRAVLVVIRN
jgi:predicted RNA methylase